MVDGCVSNHFKLSEDLMMIDVCVGNGLESATVTSEDLGGLIPKVGSRIQLWLRGFILRPVFKRFFDPEGV